MSHKILILGVGNDILMDDGIGPRLLEEIKKSGKLDGFPNIHYNTACTGGMDMLELIRDFDMVIILDAIKTKDGKPGDIYQFTPDDFKETMHLSNLHDVSFLTAIKLGHKAGYKIPQQIRIIAIEILEDMVFGEEFTPELQSRYPEILHEVTGIVFRLVENFMMSV